MRFLSFAILIAFVALVLVFAFQNEYTAEVVFFGQHVTTSVRLLVGATFLVGMLSGWALFDLLRRSFADAFGPADHSTRRP